MSRLSILYRNVTSKPLLGMRSNRTLTNYILANAYRGNIHHKDDFEIKEKDVLPVNGNNSKPVYNEFSFNKTDEGTNTRRIIEYCSRCASLISSLNRK